MPRVNRQLEQLKDTVLARSLTNDWDEARMTEWGVAEYDYNEDGTACVCGQEDIKHVFAIRNVRNGNQICPIGSVCINHFGNKTMTESAKILEKKNEVVKHGFAKYLTFHQVYKGRIWGDWTGKGAVRLHYRNIIKYCKHLDNVVPKVPGGSPLPLAS